MPIYRYEPTQEGAGCTHCHGGFEVTQALSAERLAVCPQCGAPVRRAVLPVSVGRSISALDDRAKSAGFSKLKRVGKGEYEKQY